MPNNPQAPKELDLISDVVLNYKPKEKAKASKRRDPNTPIELGDDEIIEDCWCGGPTPPPPPMNPDKRCRAAEAEENAAFRAIYSIPPGQARCTAIWEFLDLFYL